MEALITYEPDPYVEKRTIDELTKISSGECSVCGRNTVLEHTCLLWGDIDDNNIYYGPAMECWECESLTYLKSYTYHKGAVIGTTNSYLRGASMIEYFGGMKNIEENIDVIACYAIDDEGIDDQLEHLSGYMCCDYITSEERVLYNQKIKHLMARKRRSKYKNKHINKYQNYETEAEVKKIEEVEEEVLKEVTVKIWKDTLNREEIAVQSFV